jgi:hypothetical protein
MRRKGGGMHRQKKFYHECASPAVSFMNLQGLQDQNGEKKA